MKNFLINSTVFLCSFLLCLVCFEFGLRVVNWQSKAEYQAIQNQDGTQTIVNAEFSFHEKPNSIGLRGEEVHARLPQEKRILFLGDSFTFGLGVDEQETYVSKLKEMLSARNKNLYFINGGKSGSWPGERVSFLKEHEQALSPDLVILQIFLGNDPYDALMASDKVAGVQAEPAAKTFQKSFKLKEAIKKSRALTFLWERLRVLIWKISYKIPKLQHCLFKSGIRDGPYALLLKKYYPLEEQGMNMLLDSVLQIKKACDQRGVKILLVLVPFKEQFLKRNWPQEEYDPRVPTKIVSEFAREQGLPSIDLLEYYEKLPYEIKKSIYFDQDIHWNQKGHALAAEIITPMLAPMLSREKDA